MTAMKEVQQRMSDGALVVWKIDPSEPNDPTRRESHLHDMLGCTSSNEASYVAAMTLYGKIVAKWALGFPGTPTTTTLAARLAAAEPTGWPRDAPVPFACPHAAEPRRRPDAARAPSAALRSDPTGRATAA